jgi:hypothetical protein
MSKKNLLASLVVSLSFGAVMCVAQGQTRVPNEVPTQASVEPSSTVTPIETASDIKEEPLKPEEKVVTIAVPELGYTRDFERKRIPQIVESFDGMPAAPVNPNTTEMATEYLELRGLVGEVRHKLLLEGYHVVEAGSGMVVHGQEEKAQIFDIKRRIAKGEFNGATFVLVGTLLDISPINSDTQIIGTDGVLRRRGLDLLADFSLIDTKTMQITAAFNAHGEAVEVRLDRNTAGSFSGEFVPRRAKMIKDLAASLANNVSKKLEAHGYFPERENASLSGNEGSGNPKYNRYDDKNVKVYKN